MGAKCAKDTKSVFIALIAPIFSAVITTGSMTALGRRLRKVNEIPDSSVDSAFRLCGTQEAVCLLSMCVARPKECGVQSAQGKMMLTTQCFRAILSSI